jgi:hypothetical protein
MPQLRQQQQLELQSVTSGHLSVTIAALQLRSVASGIVLTSWHYVPSE